MNTTIVTMVIKKLVTCY